MKIKRRLPSGAKTARPASPRRPSCFRTKERNTAKLLKIVGVEKFLTLRDEFGGRSLWIPKKGGAWPCGPCNVRNRCIYRWHEQGHSPAAISSALKLSPRTIVRIIRDVRASAA